MRQITAELIRMNNFIRVEINHNWIISICDDKRLIFFEPGSNTIIYEDKLSPIDYSGEIKFRFSPNYGDVKLEFAAVNPYFEIMIHFRTNGTLEYYGGVRDYNDESKYEGVWR